MMKVAVGHCPLDGPITASSMGGMPLEQALWVHFYVRAYRVLTREVLYVSATTQKQLYLFTSLSLSLSVCVLIRRCCCCWFLTLHPIPSTPFPHPILMSDQPSVGPAATTPAPEQSSTPRTAHRTPERRGRSRATSVASATPSRRKSRSLHATAPASAGAEDDSLNYSAMRRASLVVAARYRSAQRSSSLRREMGVEGNIRCSHTLSDGEVIVMEKMMASERRHQEVLRRAELINEQCATVLENEELAKEHHNMVRLQRIAQKKEEISRVRSISNNTRMMENAKRRKEQHDERITRIEENIRRVNAIHYDPFAYIAIKERFATPPPGGSPRRSTKQRQSKEGGDAEKTRADRSRSAPETATEIHSFSAAAAEAVAAARGPLFFPVNHHFSPCLYRGKMHASPSLAAPCAKRQLYFTPIRSLYKPNHNRGATASSQPIPIPEWSSPPPYTALPRACRPGAHVGGIASRCTATLFLSLLDVLISSFIHLSSTLISSCSPTLQILWFHLLPHLTLTTAATHSGRKGLDSWVNHTVSDSRSLAVSPQQPYPSGVVCSAVAETLTVIVLSLVYDSTGGTVREPQRYPREDGAERISDPAFSLLDDGATLSDLNHVEYNTALLQLAAANEALRLQPNRRPTGFSATAARALCEEMEAAAIQLHWNPARRQADRHLEWSRIRQHLGQLLLEHGAHLLGGRISPGPHAPEVLDAALTDVRRRVMACDTSDEAAALWASLCLSYDLLCRTAACAASSAVRAIRYDEFRSFELYPFSFLFTMDDSYAGVNIVDVDDTNATEGLEKQHLHTLDLSQLRVDTLEVMSRQATVNIGTIGHVAHGKSTVVRALSGVKTQKYHSEAVKNITIHLGYANAKVFQCPTCPSPDCFDSFPSSAPDNVECPRCKTPMTLRRHFSFVDCPGHHVLMATMLNGAAVMDAALLLVAANEEFPQPQTLEHLKAAEIMKLSNVIVVQNKIDLVSQVTAHDQYQNIKLYLNSYSYKYPIVPVSAQLKHNVDYLLEYLLRIPMPTRNFTAPARMTIVRSFDVNKPGESEIENLRGGVAGGTVLQGVVRLNQDLEVRPGGYKSRSSVDGGSRFSYTPYVSRAVSLKAEGNQLKYAISGGLIAVGTTLDPSLTRQDKLCGQLLGDPSGLPQVYSEIEVQYYLFAEMVGAKSENKGSKRVARLNVGESLQINIGTFTASATVLSLHTNPDRVRLDLVYPGCCSLEDQVAISRKIDFNFRLIGWGRVRQGVEAVPLSESRLRVENGYNQHNIQLAMLSSCVFRIQRLIREKKEKRSKESSRPSELRSTDASFLQMVEYIRIQHCSPLLYHSLSLSLFMTLLFPLHFLSCIRMSTSLALQRDVDHVWPHMFWSHTIKDVVEVEPVYYPVEQEVAQGPSSATAKPPAVAAAVTEKSIASPAISLWADLILHRLTERYVGRVVESLGFCVAVEHVLEYSPCQVRGPTASAWMTAVFDICVFAPAPGTRLRACVSHQTERGVFLRVDFIAAFPILVPADQLVEGSRYNELGAEWLLPLDDSPENASGVAAFDLDKCNRYRAGDEVIVKVLACNLSRGGGAGAPPEMEVLASCRGDCLGPVAWFEEGDDNIRGTPFGCIFECRLLWHFLYPLLRLSRCLSELSPTALLTIKIQPNLFELSVSSAVVA
eukprot:gene12032-8285_t